MDTVLATPQYILIVEVKNISGDIYFNKVTKQMIRTLNSITESFPNPVLQVSLHKFQLENFLKANGFPSVPIHTLVVSASRNGILHIEPDDPFHLGKIIPIQGFTFKYQKLRESVRQIVLAKEQLESMKELLLEKHTPNDENMLERFDLTVKDLKKGVQCPKCGRFGITREYGG